MKKKIAISIMAFLCILHVRAQNQIEHTYITNDGPDKNPMKGWSSGWWDNFDVSTVGFQYIEWKKFEPTDGDFRFDEVEDVINRPGSSGKHLILRLYADWFGQDPISAAGPEWLYSDYEVDRLQSPSGKYITDFNDPNYISQAIEAIEALTAHYDNDPRIYALQIGILGYWGEWHTFTYNDNNNNNVYTIEASTRNQILNSYKNNVSNAKVMGRQPWDEPLTSTGGIGFHNDFFIPNNGHSDEFDVSIALNEQWKQGPIGGESPPIDEGDREQYRIDLYETETGMNMITTGHYSTMKLGSYLRPCEDDPTGVQCQGFMELHRKMGYNYQIASATFAETLSQSDMLEIAFDMTNIGVAPIYFDWDVQFALLDGSNQPVAIFETTYDLTTIMADESMHTITMSTSLNGIAANDYELAVRFIQPNADSEKAAPWELDARNTYINFSNNLETINGAWDANNALTGGWSILGPVAVQETVLVTPNVLVFYKTNGFPHPSIDEGIGLITDLGNDTGLWNTTATDLGSDFNVTNLNNYDLVIWCNTSGNGVLTDDEQQAFETWVGNGGAYMGIHAATDTYRNGSWPFYNELVGAIVQSGPNHTPNGYNATMNILESHSSTDHLDMTNGWNKDEEYYYWEQNGGQLSIDNNNVLFVESTGSNSYDAARPIAWYKTSITVDGETTPVRSFYTALGHDESDYVDNPDTSDDDEDVLEFQNHIKGAIIWALPPVMTTYTDGSWDNGTPTKDMLAVINESYNTGIDGTIEARDLMINAAMTLTVAPNSYIQIEENITVNGSLIVEHQGSVVQTTPVGKVTNNGMINVNLDTPDLGPSDFMTIGSPMTNESVSGVWSDALSVRKHNTLNFIPNQDVEDEMPGAENFADDTNDNWSIYTGDITPAEGYIVRPQIESNGPGGVFSFTYSEGTLNNGTINFNTVYQEVGTDSENKNHSPNIVANPYASAISANDFINFNEAVQEIFFWEHLTPPNSDIPGAGSINFSMEDISMYNLTGGMAAANDTGDSTTPNGFISTGQGFAFKASSNDGIVFTNAMRRADNNNTLRNLNTTERLWLRISNEEYRINKQTLIGFNTNATANLDSGYDSNRLATVISIYSHLTDGSEQLGIQSREAFNDEIKIPIGFSTQMDELLEYTIALSAIEGVNLVNAQVYLLDTETNIVTNLNENTYKFTSDRGTFHNRFVLQFIEEEILGTDSFENDKVLVYPNPSKDIITIKLSNSSQVRDIKIYDMLGREVRLGIQNNKVDISSLQSGIYLLKISATSGMFTTKFLKK